eukprot:869341-Pleurochrysis_carterae.AAC.1
MPSTEHEVLVETESAAAIDAIAQHRQSKTASAHSDLDLIRALDVWPRRTEYEALAPKHEAMSQMV